MTSPSCIDEDRLRAVGNRLMSPISAARVHPLPPQQTSSHRRPSQAAISVRCYDTHMTIPVSALQRNASEVIRRVAGSGISEEITDRGRVVAILSPPVRADGIERLRKMGMTRPPDPDALRQALEQVDSLPALALSEALAEQRDRDR